MIEIRLTDGLAHTETVDPKEPWTQLLLADGRLVLVPTELLTPDPEGNYRLSIPLEELGYSATSSDALVIPVLREEMVVHKVPVERGRVKLQKKVHHERRRVEDLCAHESVEIETVAINRVVEAAPAVRYENETTIIPLVEEVLVVEKRLMLREELHVRRVREQVPKNVEVTLRREELIVERTRPSHAPPHVGSGNGSH